MTFQHYLVSLMLISSAVNAAEISCLHKVSESCRCSWIRRMVECKSLELPLVAVLTNYIPPNTKRLILRRSWTDFPTILTPSHFEKFQDIEVLDVSFNFVEVIKPATFNNLIYIKKINLSNNRLRILEKNTFCKKLLKLKILDLSNNQILLLLDLTFASTPSLRHVDLRDNKIHHIGNEAFSGLSSLRSLKLSRCNVNSFPSEALKQLWNLTAFELVNPFQIKSIPAQAFRYNVKLRRLRLEDFRHLSTQRLHKYAFVGLTQLRQLAVVSCNLTSIPAAVKTLKRLRILDLSKNPLDVIERKYLKQLVHLEELNLYQTNLIQIMKAAFATLTSLKSIDLSNNRLTVLQRNVFSNDISGLQRMLLDDNWWRCDCALSWVVFTKLRESLSSVICTYPNTYRGQYFDVLLNASESCIAPIIQLSVYEVETFVGDNLSISCCGEGIPTPIITWITSTNGTIAPDAGPSLSESNIRITNVSAENAGIYRCLATNAIGSDFKDIQVSVKQRESKSIDRGLLHFGLTVLTMFLLFVLVGGVVYFKFPQCIYYSR